MSLDNIIGGSVNTWGGIDGANYRPTGFAVGNDGGVRQSYNPVPVARIDSNGHVRGNYDGFTGIKINSVSGMIERDVR